VDYIVVVQIVYGTQHLLDGLRRILLGEFALFANAVEELATSRELGDDVILVLE